MTAEYARFKARKDTEQVNLEVVGQSDDLESHKRETLNALIGEQVLYALGEPGDLLKVQVWPLWKGTYRVNVFVGASAACAKIPHSFFVVADSDGNVLESTPAIRRLYLPGRSAT